MSDFAIRKIDVQNVGVFQNLQLEFPEKPAGNEDKAEIHIFTGPNGSGKSTVLKILSGIGGKDIFLKNVGPNYSENFSIKYHYEIGNIQYYFELGRNNYTIKPKKDPNLISYQNSIINSSSNVYLDFLILAYSGHRIVSGISKEINYDLNLNPLEDSLVFESSVQPQKIMLGLAVRKFYETFSTNQYNEDKNPISKLEKELSKLFEVAFKFHLDESSFYLKVNQNGLLIQLDQLASGVISLLSWLGDILIRLTYTKGKDNISPFDRRIILFLDEIDVHLHPAWQRKVLPMVQTLFPNAQIFVSTHSPFVVGSVDGAYVYSFSLEGNKARVAPPVVSEDAQSYESILREVFQINSLFGPQVENDLNQFRDLVKKAHAERTQANLERVREMVSRLQGQSPELDLVLNLDLRQLEKRFA